MQTPQLRCRLFPPPPPRGYNAGMSGVVRTVHDWRIHVGEWSFGILEYYVHLQSRPAQLGTRIEIGALAYETEIPATPIAFGAITASLPMALILSFAIAKSHRKAEPG